MSKTRREFLRVQARGCSAAGKQRPATDSGCDGGGISPSMLRNSRAVVRGGATRLRGAAPNASPLPSPADQASEITRLKRELDRTRMERDVLAKAIGICAEVPR